ncbi:MAG: ElyC/SanA/YdcF family protein [Spirochaetota bacterium]
MKGLVRAIKRLLYFFIFVIILIITPDIYITVYSSVYIFNDINKVPFNKCGLLPGTSKYRPEGGVNPYFTQRLDAAAQLYKSGKIQYIIASGDNREVYYNEPKVMIASLVERGVPEDKIIPDYAGFRTLDSVVRAKDVFEQNSITLISQKFHNERGVYIGRKHGMDVVGFNAANSYEPGSIKIRIREVFARIKALIDIHIIKETPKFLGDKINIK